MPQTEMLKSERARYYTQDAVSEDPARDTETFGSRFCTSKLPTSATAMILTPLCLGIRVLSLPACDRRNNALKWLKAAVRLFALSLHTSWTPHSCVNIVDPFVSSTRVVTLSRVFHGTVGLRKAAGQVS